MKNKEKKIKMFKLIILTLIVVLFIFIIIELFPIFKDLSTEEGRLKFKGNIDSLGIKGIFEILGLILAQVLIAILPGEPIELLAGMCYGTFWGTVIVIFGTFISSFIVFFSVRFLGREFIYSFVSKEKVNKIENSKLFSNQQTLYITLFILFFIPGTPKDLIIYIAGLLPINSFKFLLISTLARFPSIVSSTIVGSNILYGNWDLILIVYGLTFLISGIVYLLVKNKHKHIIAI